MAQQIDDILKELDAGYNPQRQAINNQIAQLQPQADAQIQGLKTQQQNAFTDITNGARDRGMGFSGIPIDEQAKYTGGTFLPAVANVQSSLNNSKNSLTDALNNVNLDQRKSAYGIRDGQLTREEAARQADAQLAAQKAAAAAQTSAYSNLLGGSQQVTTPQPQTPKAPVPTDKILSGGKSLNDATTALQSLLSSKNSGVIRSTITAIQQSAQRGNTYDQAKLQIINSRPEFKQYLANFGGATF